GMLLQGISTFARTAAQPRFGLATQRVTKGVTKVVLLMQDQVLEIDPVPRQLRPNGQATLRGRLAGEYQNPKISISDPAGSVSNPPTRPGKEVQAELRCGDHPGQIQIQVRAEAKGSERGVANFPVACGVDQPTTVALAATEVSSTDIPAQEKKTLELI